MKSLKDSRFRTPGTGFQETKKCARCEARKGPEDFATYKEKGKRMWPANCRSCGGRAPMESLKEKRSSVGKAPHFKAGYEAGGCGLLLDELLYAVEQAAGLKGVALAKRKEKDVARRSWLGHFTWKQKVERLKTEFLQKVQLKVG